MCWSTTRACKDSDFEDKKLGDMNMMVLMTHVHAMARHHIPKLRTLLRTLIKTRC